MEIPLWCRTKEEIDPRVRIIKKITITLKKGGIAGAEFD